MVYLESISVFSQSRENNLGSNMGTQLNIFWYENKVKKIVNIFLLNKWLIKSNLTADNDEYNLFVNGILITSAVGSSWLLIMYSIFDFTQKPAFIRKYKVNPHTNEPPDYKKLLKV